MLAIWDSKRERAVHNAEPISYIDVYVLVLQNRQGEILQFIPLEAVNHFGQDKSGSTLRGAQPVNTQERNEIHIRDRELG